MELIALLDIDDTIADLMSVWLRRYNHKYQDNLKRESIVSWNMAQYTLPNCQSKVYELLKSKTLYNTVKPLPNALDGVNLLRDLRFTIVYVTAGAAGGEGAKLNWLKKHGFWQEERDHFIQTHSKHLIKGDLIIDDKFENVVNSDAFGLLFDQPWNSQHEYKNRMMGWNQIIGVVKNYKDNII